MAESICEQTQLCRMVKPQPRIVCSGCLPQLEQQSLGWPEQQVELSRVWDGQSRVWDGQSSKGSRAEFGMARAEFGMARAARGAEQSLLLREEKPRCLAVAKRQRCSSVTLWMPPVIPTPHPGAIPALP